MEINEEMWWKINSIVHNAMKYAQDLCEDEGFIKPKDLCNAGSDITS